MTKIMTAPVMADGQIENVVAKLRDALRKHRNEFGSESVQQVLGVENLGMELMVPFRKRVEAFLVLAPRVAKTITLTEQHDPDTFYRTRAGLYVYDDFRSRIVAHAKPVESGMVFKIEGFDLQQNLTDAEIEASLPQKHLFGDDWLCAIIAELISKQPCGEEGALINNGRANLFYTGSCVVSVRWRAVYRKWHVDTWGRGGRRWRAGDRVFSPAN